MPAKDKHHDAVVNALKKDNWTITNEQVLLAVDKRHLWIDIQASKEDAARVILVEVKGFEYIPSPIAYLQSVIGQYLLYKIALDYLGISYPLYLAVPEAAYNGILSEEIGKLAIQSVPLKLLVFDTTLEEVLQWQN